MKIPSIKNIKDYIQGNYNYHLDRMGRYPKYLQEQVRYRLTFCTDDCQPAGKCIHCGCPPHKKVYNRKSCNKGERFPDLMNKEEWNNYKQKHNIIIDD